MAQKIVSLSGNTLPSYEEMISSGLSGSGSGSSGSGGQTIVSLNGKVLKPYTGETYSDRNFSNFVSSFEQDANNFFRRANRDTDEKNYFNAADYFEERKQQADSLKIRASTISQYLNDHMDSYTPESYDYMMNLLSTFDTEVDDVMSRYQPSVDSREGLRAYEDEFLAAMERNEQLNRLDSMAAFAFDPGSYAYNSMRQGRYTEGDRGVKDNWTAEQRYRLGLMQMEDPNEARKYAGQVNAGQDPYILYEQAEREKADMLALDLNAEKRELDRMKAELDNYSWDRDVDFTSASDRAAFEKELQRREKEFSKRQKYYNQAKREQESAQFASAVDRNDFAVNSGYVNSGFALPIFIEDADPDELIYEYINNQNDIRSQIDRENNSLAAKGYDLLEPEEVGIYNYYYATEGPDKAQQYLNNIQETLNKRMGERAAQSKNGDIWKQYFSAAVSGYGNAVSGIQKLFNTEDEYIPTSAYQFESAAIREDLAGTGPKLPEIYGGASLGQLGYDLINTTANMAPSILLSTVAGAVNPTLGATVGAVTMGGSAAGNAYQEALNSGYSKEQARTYSALVGASEVGLEYLLGGISKLGGEIPGRVLKAMVKGVDNALARAAIQIGGSMVSEGFEEGLQEVITPWIKNLTLMVDEDVNWNEVAYSTLMGALSGGVMEGPGVSVSETRIANINNKLKDLGAKGNTRELAELIVKHRAGESLNKEDFIKLATSESAMQILEGMRSGNAEGYNTPAVANMTAEQAEAERPKVSTEGRAIKISANTAIDTLDFAEIKDGKATIQLKDGGTVDYQDVNFASTKEANQFYTVESLPAIDTENANILLRTIQDADVGKNTMEVVAIREAYRLGYMGAKDSELRNSDAKILDPKLQDTIYAIGKQQRSDNAKLRATAQAVNVNPSEGYKKVVFEGKTPKLNKKNKAEVDFVDYIAENFSGNTVHVYESYRGRDGRYYYRDSNGKVNRAPNGKYVNGEIWLDLKAGDNGEGLMLNTFAHEMYHHIEKFNKTKAQELAEFVVRELGIESVDKAIEEQIKKARKAGLGETYFVNVKGMTQEQARNEVYTRAMSDFVADSLETVFTRGNAAETIAKLHSENRTLFDEIKAFIDNWVSKLKKFYSDKTISQEGAVVAQLKNFEQLQRMFMEAMQGAGENYRAAEIVDEKSTTQESDAVFSERNNQRITMTMTDADRTEILKNKVITAPVYEGQAEKSIASENSYLNSHRDNLVKAALVKIGEEFGVFTDYRISDVDVDIRLSRGNLKESISKKINPIQIAKLLPVMKTVVENAIGIECHTNRYFYDNNTVLFENLIGGYEEDGFFVPVRFGLRHSVDGKATLYLIVDQEKISTKGIKAEVVKATEMQNANAYTSRSAFNISLASIIPFVNSKDILRYFPDDMLTNAQKKAKWEAIAETIVYTNNKNDAHYAEFIRKGNIVAAKRMVQQAAKVAGYTNLFYHGAKKGGGFTRFREWSYFTENKQYAQRYAQRDNPGSLYEVYVKMERPFDTRDSEARTVFNNIRNEYGLSGIQESGLPDWTDGYDITDYIDENNLDYDSVVLDEGGDLVDGKPVSRGLFYAIRKSQQVKSADVITYDDNGDIIPISQRFNAKNEDIRYSLRNEKAETTRDILSRIDVNTRNKAEKYHLGLYQDRLSQLADHEEKLALINAQIEELSADEKGNKKELTQLRSDSRYHQRFVDMLNRQLGSAERSDMMKRIVAEERQRLQKQQSREVLKDYKAEQKELLKSMQAEQRAIREELTGKVSDITLMEREFIRLAKQYEKLDTGTGKNTIKDAKTIAQLKADLKAEAKSHKEDSRIWEREFNRLLRDYETSGRQIERLEATIARQRATAKARVDSRRKTEMRHKIQRKADELNRLLIHGTKHRNIPEFLQPAVADILDAINMEVRDGDQRRKTYEATLARYDRQIEMATDPLVREALIEKRDSYAAKGDQFANKIAKLQEAYKQIRDGKVPNMEIDEGLAGQLDILFEKTGNTPLGQMTMDQLEAVNDVLNVTKATITNANKLFQEGQRQGVEESSKSAMREVRSVGGGPKKTTEVAEAVQKFGWNNLKPVYVFEAIGSKVMTNLFNNLRKGEDTLAVDLEEGKAFFRNQWNKHKGKDWDMEKKWKFTSTSSKSFELDLNQIMSLYALSKRDQARDHLRVGGFSFDSQYKAKDEVKVGPIRFKADVKTTDASAYNLSDEILGEIISKLTAEQRAFVDEMQAYLSDTMAAKGNEISMKKYGIRLFKEKSYFPLRVADQYMAKVREQQTGDRKLKNSGFTKETTPNAKNPVVLSSFTQVWAEHVDEMSLYHSFVLPLDDMSRVLNYHDQFVEGEAAGSVVEAIRNAYGEGASQYIDQLIRDVNGGARTDTVAKSINDMISKAKKAQTMASLSVTIQQPSAILRACSMIDGKYFLGRKVTEATHNRTWDEIKKWAPIAIIKEMGGFDTNVGKSTVDYLTDTTDYDGFGEKFKAFFTDGDFRDDALGRLPALADELSWGVIWNAIKREQADKHPNMDVKSDAFMKLVADRFTDVIVHTQVYDSVFSRSGMMRSKDTGVKMATAFMAEPTTTANMLAVAMIKAKRGEISKADAAKTVGAIVASLALNAALVSVVYALRDDDEDKRYDEKWIENFYSNFFESLNPIGYIPVLRDVQSMMRGFDVERTDMALFGDLMNAINGLGNEKLSAWDKVEGVIGSVGNLLGIPLKNIIRDGKGVFKTAAIALDKDDPKTKTGRYMARRGLDLSDGDQLLLAIQRGDEEHIQRVAGRFENQQKAESALQSAIRAKYLEGDLTAEEAEELLTTNFDRDDEHEVYWILDSWDYAKENDGSTEGYIKYGKLYESIENGADYESEIDRLMEHGADASTIRSQISKTYRKQYLAGDETMREQIREKLQPVYEASGMYESDIMDKFNDWDFESEYGMTYSAFKTEYMEGNATEAEMRQAMKFYGFLNYEIEEKIRDLNKDIAFEKRFGMSLSDLYDAYDNGDATRNTLISALEFTGQTRADAQEAVSRRDIGNRLGIDYMKLDDAYKHGDISRQTFYNAMRENGATKEEADEAILGYDWLKKHVKQYPDLQISDARKFVLRISDKQKEYTLEDYGVSINAYLEYTKRRPECKGVDANGDGQIDSGTLRDDIFRMIDSLPISNEAKDGLAQISYGIKSVRRNAPWH